MFIFPDSDKRVFTDVCKFFISKCASISVPANEEFLSSIYLYAKLNLFQNHGVWKLSGSIIVSCTFCLDVIRKCPIDCKIRKKHTIV